MISTHLPGLTTSTSFSNLCQTLGNWESWSRQRVCSFQKREETEDPPYDCLCYNNVRCGCKDRECGDNGEEGESDQTEPVEDHRRKLPVVLRRCGLVVVPAIEIQVI